MKSLLTQHFLFFVRLGYGSVTSTEYLQFSPITILCYSKTQVVLWVCVDVTLKSA